MNATVFYGEMKGGKLQCKPFLDALKGIEGTVELTVKKWHPKRSKQANSYYWKVMEWCGLGLADLGWEPCKCTKEAVHAMMGQEFLTVDEHVKDGAFLRRTRSTTELNSQEFAQYLEHVIQYAAENIGINIPAAGEQTSMAA